VGQVLDDPWFWSHYDDAAGIVRSLVPAESLTRGKTIVDFGCGDGATALGVASKIEAGVIGLDIYRSFDRLPDLARDNLGTRELPRNLSFVQNEPSQPLPLGDGSVDLVYTWSVFEHLADVPGILAELHRVSKEGAYLFIQVEPLFYSPFGSHLRRLIDEPWGHLLGSEDTYLARAAAARDTVPIEEQDVLYRTHEFETVKGHLIAEYRGLNRITAQRLLDAVSDAGFDLGWKKLMSTELEPPRELSHRLPVDLLKTDQIVLLARKA
jgi:ubiquinone/menaquinone biosynthesis C-methylase UbiE